MQRRLTLAFDIDGTLINGFGKLDKDVFSIFQKADKKRTTFIFMTGNDINIALDCVKKINAILPENEQIKPYIATSCGSRIYSPNMEIIYDSKIDKEIVEDMVTNVRKEDEKVVFMYRNDEDNYIEKQPLSKNLAKMLCFKLLEKLKSTGGMKLVDISKDDFQEYTDNIKNLFVVPSKKKYRPAVISSLEKITYHTSQQVYNGTYIQVPASTKKDALIKILEYNAGLKIYDLNMPSPKDYRKVIYFGDGTNDAELLRECEVSFARGENAKEVAIESAKYHYKNLEQVADALFVSIYEKDKKIEKLTKSDIFEK